ncbi:hypothetical protein [Aliirhizobium smilacinae]|uniref:Uncharacterized protein n=1 Tax=Aliirhizobium smilacinae TaxID=1395944 RepID=A0A5C4XQQ6_9HYPH|nr:hypothetical protein [Rhizobium smilacinae]TNM65673.1 hypothetical protein FHP24_05345 [Rhizobium smilacinae]
MTENHSKARQAAEKAFDKAKAPIAAGDRAREELDVVTKARQEKTSRLREARLAMEAQNSAPQAADAPDKNIKKP